MEIFRSPSLRDLATEHEKELLDQILNDKLSLGDIQAVCLLINREYLMKGINSDYSPNGYGRELEKLLDVVNRPRLVQ